ncbi:MAG TPA: phytanoyl-CoA dioxygenase family protein [Gallionellaceae bacterium]
MHAVFEEAGFAMVEEMISPAMAQMLLAELARQDMEPLSGGIRRIDKLVPEVAELAHSPHFIATAQRHLPGQPELVRAIYFDKSPDNNWFVTWHQDRTVSVSTRFEAEGWGPWSVKSGNWHVQPPLEVLQNMVTLRVHLDPATRSNGCLKVIPGSHNIGLLRADRAQEHIDQERIVYCESPAGGAVIMRPHILHSSEKALNAMPRRILHFEYSSYRLPDGIFWNA